ncbi:hypothetical protein GOP56_19945 [Brevibacillus sp. 7WMA2]|uniref:hypothetical protein n=1 Tax=Brevibacillus sp. 7WMA2 TaxID=2683193 RepID=UPI0013A71B73|nr:hypothetical protein [Brevibacillus sp. 7WMA2]QIC07640.1 hypothetical protein GOP56_19945 [Brevibacillus sp. 7WMA2]
MSKDKIDVSIKFDETTFRGLIKSVGDDIYKNWSWVWSLIITLILFVLLFCSSDNLSKDILNLANTLAGVLLGASAGIFGIVIAALTLTLTLFHQSLLPLMLKEKVLQMFLLPFWFAVVLWAISIVICIFIYVFIILQFDLLLLSSFFLEVFIFLFATFYTVGLTGLVIRLALQRAQISE